MLMMLDDKLKHIAKTTHKQIRDQLHGKKIKNRKLDVTKFHSDEKFCSIHIGKNKKPTMEFKIHMDKRDGPLVTVNTKDCSFMEQCEKVIDREYLLRGIVEELEYQGRGKIK